MNPLSLTRLPTSEHSRQWNAVVTIAGHLAQVHHALDALVTEAREPAKEVLVGKPPMFL